MLPNHKYVVTLNITLDDLLKADSIGKWWIVGSACSGKVDDLGYAATTSSNQNQSANHFSEKLLKIAKQQKMNTEERLTYSVSL